MFSQKQTILSVELYAPVVNTIMILFVVKPLHVPGYHKLSLMEILSENELNSFPPRQNVCHVADDISICIFMNEKFCVFIRISKFE